MTIYTPCPACNGNRHYLSGDVTVWCAMCQPARALGQERIKDCRAGHRNDAMQYYASKKQAAWVVTLAGLRQKKPTTHDYHVLASSMAGSIHAAITNNFILDGKARFVKARLCCPCDARGVQ